VASSSPSRTRDRRLEVRTTEEERDVIVRAAATEGTDLTSFVVSHLLEVAQQVLADRERFSLSAEAAAAWEAANNRPARELPGLRRLLERPTPFGV